MKQKNGEDIAERPAYTRFSAAEWAALRKAAADEHRSVSSYVRHSVTVILRGAGYLNG